MKKGLKIFIFVLIMLLIILVGDTIYAYINKSVPVIHLKDKSNNVDKGIFFDVYYCDDKENKIVGKFSKFECSVDDEKKEEVPTTTTTKKVSARKKAFSEEILNKYTEYGNVDKDNLKSFEIKEILMDGYYASKAEEKYYQVRFNYECKDGTRSCVSLQIETDYVSFNEYDGYYNLWVLAKNDKVLKFKTGISININSDYVEKLEEIE